MNRDELLRMVDSLHKDWEIDKETVFGALEDAFALAIKKQYSLKSAPRVSIERHSGVIHAFENDQPLDISTLGRVAYQFAKQSFMQKLREGKNRSLYDEYVGKKSSIVSARVVRTESDHVVCEIGRRTEAALPRAHQIPGESYPIGRRIKTILVDVEKRGADVALILSRADDRFVSRLFELEVPEMQNGTCVVRGTAREPGYRTKLLVQSTNDRVDCIGACVGVRGSRIKNVVDELNGENIDIIPFSENEELLVRNAMKPAIVKEVVADRAKKHATVYVDRSELSQAIGKGGRNVRLASRLTGWEIDIFEQKDSGPSSSSEEHPVDAGRGTPPSEEKKSE